MLKSRNGNLFSKIVQKWGSGVICLIFFSVWNSFWEKRWKAILGCLGRVRMDQNPTNTRPLGTPLGPAYCARPFHNCAWPAPRILESKTNTRNPNCARINLRILWNKVNTRKPRRKTSDQQFFKNTTNMLYRVCKARYNIFWHYMSYCNIESFRTVYCPC